MVQLPPGINQAGPVMSADAAEQDVVITIRFRPTAPMSSTEVEIGGDLTDCSIPVLVEHAARRLGVFARDYRSASRFEQSCSEAANVTGSGVRARSPWRLLTRRHPRAAICGVATVCRELDGDSGTPPPTEPVMQRPPEGLTPCSGSLASPWSEGEAG